MTTAPEIDLSSTHTRRLELEVAGMTCGACATRVERKLGKVDGVRASVNYATRIATVDADESVSVDELCAVVDRAGYAAAPRAETVTSDSDPDRDHARSIFRRLVVAVVLFVPLADLSIMFSVVPDTRITGWQWILVALALPILTWSAWPFYRVAARNLRHGTSSMETLISLGILAAAGWSLYTMFGTDGDDASRGVWQSIVHSDSIYLEVAAGVTVFVLAGRYFEARAKSNAGGALRALAALSAKDVSILLTDGSEMRIPVGELNEQQKFVVRPGETIATDGLVVSGTAGVDMSAMTGESRPVDVEAGSTVVGGTVALNGRLVVEAAAVGPDTKFAAMIRLVEEAQSGKATAQRLADRLSAVFVPCVVVLAALTLAGWVLSGAGLESGISAALAVLIIACPCALGLATPTALMVASGRGAQLGIFLKGHQALDASRQIDTVVFDKTGTVTNGELSVVEVTLLDGWDRDEVMGAVAALERASEHAVGQAIAASVSADTESDEAVEDFTAETGHGVHGLVGARSVAVGAPRWISAGHTVHANLARARRRGEEAGHTVVYARVGSDVCAAISVADTVKDDAAEAITELHRRGMRTMLVTGDNASAAGAVAERVGITEVVAEVLPEGKVDLIDELRAQGATVAMVGDGINDGPALATADLGLAIGRGTDVAIGAADIILVRHALMTVPEALGLARATRRTIRTNMVWAFGYNVAAIPIAAAGLLNPLIAGAAMAFSSFFVVSNSLRIRQFAKRPDTLRRDLYADTGTDGSVYDPSDEMSSASRA
ncbi:heavy metal translocating P-type ATPase [Williamsia phyllosphaerae]|uniref:Cation-transporting P-type ATPase A n=1 Tax=Williamsia phyllosphaerae TaxID=885042 RepID=A0ABQ1UN12_9NOCA|nr:heavy metal translocating P-type ATPase [Williamsia phyllosphaerae]GGF20947.1 cation-transporting P-type ATPase A [Williamsia phyllosphaerae]